MISKNAAGKIKFQIFLFFSTWFFLSAGSILLSTMELNQKTEGWFGRYLWAAAMRDIGWHRFSVPGLRLNPHETLAYLCTSRATICNNFENEYRSYFYRPVFALAGVSLVFAAAGLVGLFRGRRRDEKHRRGARLVDANELRRQIRKEPADIFLGGVPLPRDGEVLHTLLAGSTGSGKSVAIRTFLRALRARGDRVIIVDAGGIFLSEFARRGDSVLNPFDRRSQAWSPFAEALSEWETEAIARSLIPSAEGSEKVWADLAKSILAGLIEQCRLHGMATNRALAWLATCGDPLTLARVLGGHPAHGLVASGSPQTIGSILTTLNERLAGLRYLKPEAGKDAFSVANWVREGSGWLFFSYGLGQRESIKTIISAQLDCAVRAVLSLEPNPNRRIWLIVDELPLLGRIASIEEFLTNGRKFGGAAVLGIQAISQLRQTYGRDGAATLLSCLSSQVVLRQPDGETAELMSKALGDKEIQRTNQSRGKTDHGRSENAAEQIATTRAVMASELQRLPDLAGYLSLAGDRPIAKIKLEIPPSPVATNPPFVAAPMTKAAPFVLPAHLHEGTAPAAERPRPAQSNEFPANWRDETKED